MQVKDGRLAALFVSEHCKELLEGQGRHCGTWNLRFWFRVQGLGSARSGCGLRVGLQPKGFRARGLQSSATPSSESVTWGF